MNSVNLIGRISLKPTIKKNASVPVAFFSVAVEEYHVKKKEKAVYYISCVLFGKQVEFLETYCSVGDLIAIEGKLITSKVMDGEYAKYESKVSINILSLLQKKKGNQPMKEHKKENQNNKEREEVITYDSNHLPF